MFKNYSILPMALIMVAIFLTGCGSPIGGNGSGSSGGYRSPLAHKDMTLAQPTAQPLVMPTTATLNPTAAPSVFEAPKAIVAQAVANTAPALNALDQYWIDSAIVMAAIAGVWLLMPKPARRVFVLGMAALEGFCVVLSVMDNSTITPQFLALAVCCLLLAAISKPRMEVA